MQSTESALHTSASACGILFGQGRGDDPEQSTPDRTPIFSSLKNLDRLFRHPPALQVIGRAINRRARLYSFGRLGHDEGIQETPQQGRSSTAKGPSPGRYQTVAQRTAGESGQLKVIGAQRGVARRRSTEVKSASVVSPVGSGFSRLNVRFTVKGLSPSRQRVEQKHDAQCNQDNGGNRGHGDRSHCSLPEQGSPRPGG
jgi:hypothetical protein